MMAEFTAQIFSPRWGHEDTYTVELSRKEMIIRRGPQTVRCVHRDGHDPEWQGESLEDILENDSIHPPAVLPRALEYFWRSWRNGEIDDAAAATELAAFVEWLNVMTRAKPRTEFWQRYF
jgi:hypothetical protein